MEAKQYVTKQPMDHWRNQEIKKIPREKWQQKHDDLKLTGHSKSSTKRDKVGHFVMKNWWVYPENIALSKIIHNFKSLRKVYQNMCKTSKPKTTVQCSEILQKT